MSDRIVILNGGLVEQQGAPLELYDKPTNLFVATFIGSPPMNLIEAVATRDDGQLIAVTEDGLKLSLAGTTGVVEHAELTVGIRPEHLELSFDSATGGLPFAIDFIEDTGSDSYVAGSVGIHRVMVARNGRIGVDAGPAFVSVRPGGLHVFDRSTGRRLS